MKTAAPLPKDKPPGRRAAAAQSPAAPAKQSPGRAAGGSRAAQATAESDTATHAPPALAEREREAALLQLEDDFYKVLSGGTRIAMLIAMVDLGLAQLLMRRGPLTEDEILSALDLHRGRGHKWVLLLESVGLLVPIRDSAGGTRYDQPALSRALVDPAAPNHFFYRDFLRFWRVASSRDLTSLLHGAKVTDPVRYPPVLWDDVVLLHEWMRDGALATLASIERRFDFGRYRRILDVAGGDATMATTLARKLPQLELTVFNLPAAATLCRRTIGDAGLTHRVHVIDGDFRTDPFPTGFDLVMFSRVMADWSPAVCRMLMQKAHAALLPGGHLLIAEPLRDDNPDLAIAWEHSYLPYDDFGANVYKKGETYQQLLVETGFRVIAAHPRQDTIHGVLVAERLETDTKRAAD
jgi:SAM-dependent methyltransferase